MCVCVCVCRKSDCCKKECVRIYIQYVCVCIFREEQAHRPGEIKIKMLALAFCGEFVFVLNCFPFAIIHARHVVQREVYAEAIYIYIDAYIRLLFSRRTRPVASAITFFHFDIYAKLVELPALRSLYARTSVIMSRSNGSSQQHIVIAPLYVVYNLTMITISR